MAKDFTKVYDENARLKAELAKLKEALGAESFRFREQKQINTELRAKLAILKDEYTCEECEKSFVDKETGINAPSICMACWNAMVTKLRAELKGKDELLFAYESVRAPVNPLLAKNVTFKEFIRHVIKVHCWGIEEIDGGDAQDKALELGLIEAHIATEEDVDPEFDKYNVGDTIYRFSDILKGATDGVQDESI